MKLNKQGGTRYVIMLRNYVIKIPSWYSYKNFLNGLVANINETALGAYKHPCLAELVMGNRFGLFVIQKRIKPVKHRGLFWVELSKLTGESLIPGVHLRDVKPENYGYDRGQLKRLDYGS